MTGQSTATVETLTAEVRVLMVGNRQVTQSVYKQLDCVDIADIEPFGRVRASVGDGLDDDDVVRVVGRCAGELVRATVMGVRKVRTMTPAATHYFWHWVNRMNSDAKRVADETGLIWNPSRYEVCPIPRPKTPFVRPVEREKLHFNGQKWEEAQAEWDQILGGHRCDMDALWRAYEEDLKSAREDLASERRTRALAEALPLIVLAGLR